MYGGVGQVLLLSYKILVNVLTHDVVLRLWQLAVRMASYDATVDAVANTEGIPHLAGCLVALSHGLVCKPLVVWIAKQQDGTRTDHGNKLMMVVREPINIILMKLLLK